LSKSRPTKRINLAILAELKPDHNIALLFFSRTAKPEAAAKPFLKGKCDRNVAIASALINRAMEVGKESKLPFFHFHEGKQIGATFGEKIANAYQELFNQGFSSVIAIGNDSPGLECIDWEYALTQLNAGVCVLGPSQRGGAYFIGITKEMFQQASFAQLPWQTDQLLATLEAYCSKGSSRPNIIPCLLDANSVKDLDAIISDQNLDASFRKWIASLLLVFNSFRLKIESSFYTFFLTQSTESRAP
jgi:hypothetical protein